MTIRTQTVGHIQGTKAQGEIEAPPAFVLGSGLTVLGVIRSLGRAGIRAYAVSEQLGFVSTSRWCHRPQIRLPRYAPLKPFLDSFPSDSGVIFPCSDEWVSAVSELDDDTASRFRCSQASPATLTRFLDKAEFANLLQQENIPHPQTHMIKSEEDIVSLAGSDITGFFLKPRDSQAFYSRYRVKAFTVSSPEEAISRLRQLVDDEIEVVLQEYIPGPPTNHYFIDGFVDRHGLICALFARQRLRMYPPKFGNSSLMRSIPLEQVAPAMSSLASLLAKAAYRGIFSAEFKFDDRDQRFKLLEVNVRPWWFIEFMTNCGINVCRMAYDDALENNVQPADGYSLGETCIYATQDLNTALRRMRVDGFNPFLWTKTALTAHPVMWQWSDPLPTLAEFGLNVRKNMARIFLGGR